MTIKNKLAKTATVIGIALGGGVVGFAASNALVPAIQANFDTVFNLAKSQKSTIADLQSKLNSNTQQQSVLQNQIADLKNQLKDKDNQIIANQQGYQAQLNNLQNQLNAKQAEADQLKQQLAANSDLEKQVEQLKNYTDQKVGELQ